MQELHIILLELYELLNLDKSIEETINHIFNNFRSFIPFDRIGVALIDSDNNMYSLIECTQYTPALKRGYTVPLHKTSLNNIIKSKEVRIIDNYHSYLRSNPSSESTKLLISEGIASSIAYPLITNNVCTGVIIFSSKTPRAYNESVLPTIKTIANVIAILVERYLLTDDLILASITGFAKLLEAKDSDTGLHIERVQNYSKVLAAGLKQSLKYNGVVNDKFIEDIYKFSPLHDIGKVGIADGILFKPGKLSAEEFAVMKKHTAIGAEVLKKSNNNALIRGRGFFDMGIEITEGHHERFDGNGYPNKLLGEAIPLSARIVSVADVLDALTSKRVYKLALGLDAAIEMIEKESGKMFDPEIVKTLIDCKDEILDVYTKYKEDVDLYR